MKTKIKFKGKDYAKEFQLKKQVYTDYIIEVNLVVEDGDSVECNYKSRIEAYINNKKTSELVTDRAAMIMCHETKHVRYIRFRFNDDEGRIDLYENKPRIPKI